MAIPGLQAPNNEQAARAVYQHIRALQPPVRHLTLWPLSRTSRAFGEWWLTPRSDAPSHQHARLSFARAWDAADLMVAGFGATRGFGRQAEALVDSERIMHPNWFWSRLLSDTLAGAFEIPLRTVMDRSDQPVWAQLDLYTLGHEPDPALAPAPALPDDRLAFALLDHTLALTRFTEATAELAPLNGVTDLRELLLRIEGLPGIAWMWIEVRIGVRARYAESSPGSDADAWGAQELWDRVLSPWLPWVH